MVDPGSAYIKVAAISRKESCCSTGLITFHEGGAWIADCPVQLLLFLSGGGGASHMCGSWASLSHPLRAGSLRRSWCVSRFKIHADGSIEVLPVHEALSGHPPVPSCCAPLRVLRTTLNAVPYC